MNDHQNLVSEGDYRKTFSEIIPVKMKMRRFLGIRLEQSDEHWSLLLKDLSKALDLCPSLQLFSHDLWFYDRFSQPQEHWMGYHVLGHELIEEGRCTLIDFPSSVGVRTFTQTQYSHLKEAELLWMSLFQEMKGLSYPPGDWGRMKIAPGQKNQEVMLEVPLHKPELSWEILVKNS
jgi:hypothetical protein